jgi:adenylate kinase
MYLILLGAPGTGKGTQAKLLAERLGLAHIATGNMFREAVQKGSELGRQARAHMDTGNLVPDELTIGMLKERVHQPDAAAGAVIDGFPRTMEQAKALDSMIEELGGTLTAALNIEVSDDELVGRLSGRWMCPQCGEIYHERSRPPREAGRCDRCGTTLLQRDDDTSEVVRERLRVQRPPAEVLKHYSAQGKLRDINGEQPPEQVTLDILHAIGINSDLEVAAH